LFGLGGHHLTTSGITAKNPSAGAVMNSRVQNFHEPSSPTRTDSRPQAGIQTAFYRTVDAPSLNGLSRGLRLGQVGQRQMRPVARPRLSAMFEVGGSSNDWTAFETATTERSSRFLATFSAAWVSLILGTVGNPVPGMTSSPSGGNILSS
jgi:hypothetical protein